MQQDLEKRLVDAQAGNQGFVFIVMALCFNVLRCFVVLSGVQDKRNGRGEEESKDVAGLQNVFVC